MSFLEILCLELDIAKPDVYLGGGLDKNKKSLEIFKNKGVNSAVILHQAQPNQLKIAKCNKTELSAHPHTNVIP